ncbi:MAG: phospholipase [Gammaproteobacteria bacterium]|nr:phospholipase [Gammaproteobacteria bacterium]
MSTIPWAHLSETELRQLGGALQTGRLALPFSAANLQRYLTTDRIDAVVAEGQRLHQAGMSGTHLAFLLAALANDRMARSSLTEAVDLIVTAPDASGVAIRDAAVVVRELFASAQQSVLVVGYAVQRGRQVFQALAKRMEQRPALDVRLCLDMLRPSRDHTPTEELTRRFAARFVTQEWSGSRLPVVYYDPRALESNATHHASLHAKCVVVDRQVAFVSSAHFTEATQERNIEVGVLLRVPVLAEQLTTHFAALIETKVLRELRL